MHFAAQYAGIDTVTTLLDAGANAHLQDDKGDTRCSTRSVACGAHRTWSERRFRCGARAWRSR
ncbi:hypothetical protein ACFTS5_11090 [Nocardia sp. NPDC056952]|uniref:hypothetical protein n=1 Tax=Nocardia sp. NPDC056952 TaxID=3345979 RepID=UPI00362EB676